MIFREKYAFLSNFYNSYIRININGKEYAFTDVETAYQAHKNLNYIDEFVAIKNVPARAKRFAKTIPMYDLEDWNNVRRFTVMAKLLHIKFQDEDLLQKLLDTDDIEIKEDNYWKDYVWGNCDGKGFNALGKLLMKIRETKNDFQKVNSYGLQLALEYQKEVNKIEN